MSPMQDYEGPNSVSQLAKKVCERRKLVTVYVQKIPLTFSTWDRTEAQILRQMELLNIATHLLPHRTLNQSLPPSESIKTNHCSLKTAQSRVV